MDYPRISLVTPSLNQGEYIEETIRSVVEQAYPNLEYIIVDGCSRDGTAAVLEAFAGRASIITEADRGQTDALRKGFARASGEIFGWINADDLLAADALQTVSEAFGSHPEVDVVVGNLALIDDKGQPRGMFGRKEMTREDWARTCMSIPQPATFFRSSLFRQLGGLDLELEYSMDYDLFLRMATAGAEFLYIDDVLASFRLHPASKSVRVPWRQWHEELRVFRRNGGTLLSPFAYWKMRSILSYFIRRAFVR